MAKKKVSNPVLTIDQLEAAPYNPRKISEQALSGLATSIDQFGDLSGITWNIRTRHLVAGHQRVRALRQKYGNLSIVGDSIVTPTGDRFGIRVVDWPLEKERAANVAANSPTIQGEFDDTIGELLAQIQQDTPELWETDIGFDNLLTTMQEQSVHVDEHDRTPPVHEDEVPEVDESKPPDSKLGQVYALGWCVFCESCGEYHDLTEEEAAALFREQGIDPATLGLDGKPVAEASHG
jgi:hypothetical protein